MELFSIMLIGDYKADPRGGARVKIHIEENVTLNETEITIHCKQVNEEIYKLIAMLRVFDSKLTGTRGGQIYILDASQVLYIDTVDKKTFIYTKEEIYETPLKLYELEEQLAPKDFFRANKSCIINFNQIQSLKADLDGRILVTMNNKERLVVSRQYAGVVKRKLGVF